MSAALGRDWLLANLPHQGAMNLLDAVEQWDAVSIHATARAPDAAAHPLRRGSEVPASAGIEYGAQAAAAHGALSAKAPSGAGFLASVRGVRFHAPRLDAAGALEIMAEQLGAAESGVLYRFEVRAGGRCLVEGRLAVAFAATNA